MSWPYNDRPAGLRFAPAGLDPRRAADFEDEAWRHVVLGLERAEEFAEMCADDYGLPADVVAGAYADAVRARAEQQRAWTEAETTTNLTRAFAELEEQRILGRQNFSCCGTCATSEIPDERDDSRDWRGYVYFHQQDTEHLVDDGSLFLAYGVFVTADFDPKAYRRLGRRGQRRFFEDSVRAVVADVVPVLERHGLTVTWEGDLDKRLAVAGGQWFARVTSPD